MRPPRQKWQKTADAIDRLAAAVEAIALKVGAGESGAARVLAALAGARDLREHVETSEECEEP